MTDPDGLEDPEARLDEIPKRFQISAISQRRTSVSFSNEYSLEKINNFNKIQSFSFLFATCCTFRPMFGGIPKIGGNILLSWCPKQVT